MSAIRNELSVPIHLLPTNYFVLRSAYHRLLTYCLLLPPSFFFFGGDHQREVWEFQGGRVIGQMVIGSTLLGFIDKQRSNMQHIFGMLKDYAQKA